MTPPLEPSCTATGPGTCAGTCNYTTLECECLPGQKNDATLTWVNNCASSYVGETVALAFSVGTGACVTALVAFHLQRLLKASRVVAVRGGARAVVASALTQTLLVTGAAVAHWVQGYASSAFWFMFVLAAGAIGATLSAIMYTLLRVNYSAALEPFPERFVVASLGVLVGALMLPFIICFAASVAFSRDPAAYNDAVTVGLGLLPAHLALSAPMFFSCIDQLIARTEEAIGERRASSGAGKAAARPSVFLGANMPALGDVRVEVETVMERIATAAPAVAARGRATLTGLGIGGAAAGDSARRLQVAITAGAAADPGKSNHCQPPRNSQFCELTKT